MRRFCLDVESTSACDLATAGAQAYWEHPTTRVICVKYREDNGTVATWMPGGRAVFPYVWTDYRVVAHNYLFEYWCWKLHLEPKYGWPMPDLEQWDCTMARALYWGFPAKLSEAASALGLAHQIDKAKVARIKKMARPRSATPIIPGPVNPGPWTSVGGVLYTWWDQTDPVRLQELLDDCERDVLAECDLDDALPALPDRERKVFLIDGEINIRGILIDHDLRDKIEKLAGDELRRLNDECRALTGGPVNGYSVNQGAALLRFLDTKGAVKMTSLAKDVVKAKLDELWHDKKIALSCAVDTPRLDLAMRVLSLRQEAAKSSVAKLTSMKNSASQDGRCRGLFQYRGAGRTGRWAARRVQPQNMPQGRVKGIDSVIALVRKGITAPQLEPMLPGTVMDACSAMLRGCLIPEPGNVLVSVDLAQIEARVVAWLAGQQDILDVFKSGADVYTHTAAKIGSKNRQLGKVCVLALGFGMGVDKFIESAASYGITLSHSDATDIHTQWRQANHKVVSLWYDCDNAFKTIIGMPHGSRLQVGKITFRKTRKAVRIVLPSGTELTFHNTQLTPDKFRRDSIQFWGVDPTSKKWGPQRTYGGKIVENIVQATARDVMAEAMLNLKGAPDIQLIATVHDELLAETPRHLADATLQLMLATMKQTPVWAAGLPVSCSGWYGDRYRK